MLNHHIGDGIGMMARAGNKQKEEKEVTPAHFILNTKQKEERSCEPIE